MDLEQSYPAVSDLAARARRRLPHFVWEYLDSGTGTEATTRRNRTALDAVQLRTSVLHGELDYDLTTTLLGRDWAMPVGIAPVGMSGLIWPGAERALARIAREERLPYCLSTTAAAAPEEAGPETGGEGWFQLYPPRDPAILFDMLARVKAAGFRVLVLTVDVPVASRRERQRRGGVTHPPALTPRILAQVAMRPAWALATARAGMPRLRFIESYAESRGPMSSTAHIGYLLRTSPDWDYLARLRDAWSGPLVVKGVLDGDVATRLADAGADAVWVSTHAGRQFDASPAAVEALPEVRAAVGPDYPLIFDSGIAGGLDVLRAIALGADFVMLGRAWHYGLGAFGAAGAAHVATILREDMQANMGQLGLRRPIEVRERLLRHDGA